MCGELWFATKDFFYITRKSTRNGAGTSMSHTCCLCSRYDGVEQTAPSMAAGKAQQPEGHCSPSRGRIHAGIWE